jgi:putative transcriptional regulator
MNTTMRARWVMSLLCAAAILIAPAVGRAQTDPGRAFLLVANPELADPNFAGTVVLAVRAEPGGPLGVILNRPTTTALSSVYPDRADAAGRNDLVFFGGPVQPDALLFAFRSATKPPQGMLVVEDIYISGYSRVLDELLKHPEHAAEQRFFAGYSGWAEGQLEAEISQGGWYVLPLDTGAIFRMNPRTMYDELLRRALVPRIEARLGERHPSRAN